MIKGLDEPRKSKISMSTSQTFSSVLMQCPLPTSQKESSRNGNHERNSSTARNMKFSYWKDICTDEIEKYKLLVRTVPPVLKKPLYEYHYLHRLNGNSYARAIAMHRLEVANAMGIVNIEKRCEDSRVPKHLSGNPLHFGQPSQFVVLDKDKFVEMFLIFFESQHSELAAKEKRKMTQDELNHHRKNLCQRWNVSIGFKIMELEQRPAYARVSGKVMHGQQLSASVIKALNVYHVPSLLDVTSYEGDNDSWYQMKIPSKELIKNGTKFVRCILATDDLEDTLKKKRKASGFAVASVSGDTKECHGESKKGKLEILLDVAMSVSQEEDKGEVDVVGKKERALTVSSFKSAELELPALKRNFLKDWNIVEEEEGDEIRNYGKMETALNILPCFQEVLDAASKPT